MNRDYKFFVKNWYFFDTVFIIRNAQLEQYFGVCKRVDANIHIKN